MYGFYSMLIIFKIAKEREREEGKSGF